jgi:hypothetical protein
MSIYTVVYVDTGSTLYCGGSFGVVSSTGINPAVNATTIDSISIGVNLLSNGYNTSPYFPTFTFTVTTSGYYYSYMSTGPPGTLTGSYVILAKTLSIVRVG